MHWNQNQLQMKTKLKAAELDHLSLEAYKKEFIRLMKLAPKKCAQPDQALWFFIKQKHQFSDGTVHPLMLLSQTVMPWQLLAKAAIKSDKKHCLLGKAYYQVLPDGKGSLQILVEKGSAKMDKVTKAARGLLNKTGITLVLTNPMEPQEESTTPTAEEDATPMATRQQKAQTTFSTFSSLMKKLGIEL